jgi:hypothetical protein
MLIYINFVLRLFYNLLLNGAIVSRDLARAYFSWLTHASSYETGTSDRPAVSVAEVQGTHCS